MKGDGRVLRHAPLGSEIALDRDVALCAVHRPRPFGLIGSVLERREKFLDWESTIWKFREQPEARGEAERGRARVRRAGAPGRRRHRHGRGPAPLVDVYFTRGLLVT